MDREKLIEDLEAIQDKADGMGFKGTNEFNLYLREELADYIEKHGVPTQTDNYISNEVCNHDWDQIDHQRVQCSLCGEIKYMGL